MYNLEEIKRILVIGAGTMGHSIAQVYAHAGFEVALVDNNSNRLVQALKLIESNLNVLSEFNKVTLNEIPSIISRIHPTTDLKTAAKGAQFVLEAVSEIPELKIQIFNELDEICPKEVVLASNTSSLDIFRILKGIRSIDRIIAHHWFAPPHIIPLVEVIPNKKTPKEIVDFSVALLKKVGKRPVVIDKFTPSYVVNKIQNAISSAMYELLIKKIATPQQIDLAIKMSLGIRLPIVGVVQSQDFTGLDLVYDIQKSMGGILPLIREKVDKNQLGVKTGKGFYDYGGRTEEEILKKRDRMYLKQLEFLENLNNFEPI